ncbi:Neuroligin-4, Y-linked [Cytospora mali]|uniref:Neuroligin-4, Y-linked n=1 Tax=Cytospora mali TaxID=578113 RepID=A0A194W6L9_CYTMA|nr:Neuroligin-4, Y-linked [Valsa mali]
MALNTMILEHPSVGQIHGIQPEELPHVEQYLGIQYAKLANGLARGTPVETYSTPVQAAQIGPLPVADPKNCDDEHLMLQHALPRPEYSFSDTECLTLNISVPSLEARAETTGLLPVVVFVHGGGFVTGSANWPQWDLARLVERSVKSGSPLIAVGINYRLGPFGFATSSALRDAGFKPNNGLHDQKLGLRWVQKNISGFGGDPNQVTYLGSSMGAASGFYHLHSTEPLFNQLVAFGGSPMLRPFPLEVAEIAYSIITNVLGLDGLPPAEQVKSLLAIPATQLSAKLAGVAIPISAVVDGDIVPSEATYAGLANTEALKTLFPGTEWCKTIMVGDGQLDSMVMAITALGSRTDNLAATLKSCLAAVFPDDPTQVKAVVDAYGIDESNTDRMPVLHFINDIIFGYPAEATAKAWAGAGSKLGTKSFLTHFNMPNPWAGDWQGHATHALDVAILLGNYNKFLSEGQRACSEKMAGDLLAFAHGKEPFPPFSGGTDGVSMVYYAGVGSDKDESHVVNDSDRNGTGRRGILVDVAAGQPEVLDNLLKAAALLLQGPK